MQTVIMFRPLKRTVAFAVGLIFAIAPIAIVSILQPGDGLNWLGILDVVVMSCGSLLLLVGAFIWSGGQARGLRLLGVSLLILASVVMLSFAFILLPLALCAVPSLTEQKAFRARE